MSEVKKTGASASKAKVIKKSDVKVVDAVKKEDNAIDVKNSAFSKNESKEKCVSKTETNKVVEPVKAKAGPVMAKKVEAKKVDVAKAEPKKAESKPVKAEVKAVEATLVKAKENSEPKKVEVKATPVSQKTVIKPAKPANEDVVKVEAKKVEQVKAEVKPVEVKKVAEVKAEVKIETPKVNVEANAKPDVKTVSATAAAPAATKPKTRKRAHIVVVGNEKGGTGKSTISFHLAVNFMRQGLRVATVDLDGRQGTLTRYVQNRMHFMETNKKAKLTVPKHLQVSARNYADQTACKEDVARLAAEIEKLAYEHDVIIIDTPGSNNHLFRAGHGYADTLITPINDSLIDFDVLAIVNSDTMQIDNPSKYSEFVWDVRKNRASSGAGSMQWIVVRNRLTHLDARNKRQLKQLIGDLSKRIGCRTVPGLGERVIYRELFLKGLTVLDITDPELGIDMSMSHVSARRELRGLIDSINLDELVGDSAGEGAEVAMNVQKEKKVA